VSKVQLCPRCGRQRDSDAPFCAGCGRQYERAGRGTGRHLEAIGRRVAVVIGRLILLIAVLWLIVKGIQILPLVLPRSETIGLDGTAVTETIEGPGVHFSSIPTGWSPRPSEPTDEPVVCSFSRNGVTYRVRDTGYHVLGSAMCEAVQRSRDAQ
jgi:hypothetical protein